MAPGGACAPAKPSPHSSGLRSLSSRLCKQSSWAARPLKSFPAHRRVGFRPTKVPVEGMRLPRRMSLEGEDAAEERVSEPSQREGRCGDVIPSRQTMKCLSPGWTAAPAPRQDPFPAPPAPPAAVCAQAGPGTGEGGSGRHLLSTHDTICSVPRTPAERPPHVQLWPKHRGSRA